MSRMTDAMQRIKAETEPGDSPEASSQELFVPAWRVSTEGEDRSERPSDREPEAVVAPVPIATQDGTTVRFSSRWRERLAAGPEADFGMTEQFRRLAATLHQAQRVNGLRSVMVTSALPGDGKTLTAVNLALVLSESYRYNVLLLDADLRRPSIPNVIDVGGGSGLSDALRSPVERKLALVPITPRLTVLPAGQPIANSLEALTSPRMQQILDEALGRFDWVILDSPPVGSATDARLLTQMVGGTLFVIHAGRTQFTEVQKAIDALGRQQILGVVLNGIEHDSSSAYGYYGGPLDRSKV